MLKEYLLKNKDRIEGYLKIFDKEELFLYFDRLSNDTLTDNELLYYKVCKNDNEKEFMFIFGLDFFINELEEQEFKQSITNDILVYKIYEAYYILKNVKGLEKIKLTDLLKELENENRIKDSLNKHKYIEKILTQAYYLDWKLRPVENSLETDYYLEIPDNFMIKIRKRYNLNLIKEVFENKDLFIFVNGKNQFVTVIKKLNTFSKEDLIKMLENPLKVVFNVSKVSFK